MRILLLGLPGSGKGTQARLLSKVLNIPLLGMGDLLRDEVARKTLLGERIAEVLGTGGFPPNDLVQHVLFDALKKHTDYILEGFPRYLEQAQALDAFVAKAGHAVDAVLYLSIPAEQLRARLSERLVCASCGGPFSESLQETEKVCPACGKDAFMRREDDASEIVEKRMLLEKEKLVPLLQYYDGSAKFHTIDALGTPEEVLQKIRGVLDEETSFQQG